VIIRYVRSAVERMFKSGYGYKRVGVWAKELEPEDCVQESLFVDPQDSKKPLLMRLVDQMNEIKGAGAIRMASVGVNQDWLTRFSMQSPHWTTRLKDIPVAITG